MERLSRPAEVTLGVILFGLAAAMSAADYVRWRLAHYTRPTR